MENLDFILWMVLWPISWEIYSYLSSKTRSLFNQEDYSDGVKAFSGMIMICIWFIVAINLI